ncbi:hypothetical protein BT63DRAFT_416168 [Microthyrium microscopicum]|uniref:Conserved oligomeric Golgi complex subunit 1 n=1 Tax=Microthyrium microscopicum TaxID=703497 RepID=A0A6A6U853_9PEZI|nr:hypothetical protein BT63DRAFT_416168 [Microthyrium microscopicum]
MASAQVPDPRDFKDWEEAFQHPIATTRKFEQQLRSHADENAQKLRTIVGASYRDLLATADRIIAMDTQMKLVETNLALSAQKSNSKAVERIFANRAKFNANQLLRRKASFSLASQVSLLRQCAAVLARLLKSGSSPLLAAKVIVLSRLTYKVLSQNQPPTELIESLWTRLDALKRRLLQVINDRLADPEAEWKSLVDHMCAHYLTTSATPTDIFRHFHSTRLRAMERCLVDDESGAADPTKAIKLVVITAHISQFIFPKRLSDALGHLKDLPLMQQKDVASLNELELNVHAPWIAEELRTYTPWPRHDELQKLEADRHLKTWTKKAVELFVQSLQQSLAHITDFDKVVEVRKEIFQAWPWSGRGLPGVDPEEIIDQLREILNLKLANVVTLRTSEFSEVLAKLRSAIESRTESETVDKLWDPILVSADASNGAVTFKNKVRNTYQGDDEVTRAVTDEYDHWLNEITSLMGSIKTMKDDRWDLDIADDDDDGDADSRRALLSEDDPRDLEEALSGSLKKAFTELEQQLHSMISKVTEDTTLTSPHTTVICLRIIRELSQRTIGEGFSRKLQVAPQLGYKVISPLQSKLTHHATHGPLESFQLNLSKFAGSSRLPALLLWEGTPSLPIQPSSSTYRFLRDLNNSMASIGNDLWSPGTTRALKIESRSQILSCIQDAFRSIESTVDSSTTNGHTASEQEAIVNGESSPPATETEALETSTAESQSLATQKLVQLLFDHYFLQSALTVNPDSENNSDVLENSFKDLARLGTPELSRIEKSATDYWKRTYLLFALLAE